MKNVWVEYVARREVDGNSSTVTPEMAGYDYKTFFRSVDWRVAELKGEPVLSEWFRHGDELR